MRQFTFFISLAVVCSAAYGQSVASYVKLRTKEHIVQPISTDALSSFIGTKVVEIQGQVTGIFSSGDSSSLLVQVGDDQNQVVVDCQEEPPQWLQNGTVDARLLVRISRSKEYDPLNATLITAAPEDPIKKLDEDYWKKEASKKTVESHPHSLASRSGGDLHGWIGHPRFREDQDLPTSDVTPQYADFIAKWNRHLSGDVAYKMASEVVGWSKVYGVDARLVMAVMIAESDFNPNSYSSTGAMGPGQLMPDTARELGVTDAWDTKQNIMGMVKLLRIHLQNYLDQGKSPSEALSLALAAYNAGPGAVKRAGGIPPYRETQAYVDKIRYLYAQLTRKDTH